MRLSLPDTEARAPGPRGAGLLRSLVALHQDPLLEFRRASHRYGDIVRFPFGRRTFHLLSHPAHIGHVLRTRRANYDKGTSTYRLLEGFVGAGPLTARGDRWRRQREAIGDWFGREPIEALDVLIVERTERMLSRWSERAAAGHHVVLSHEMPRLTLGIIAQALFGLPARREEEELNVHMALVLGHVNRRVERPLSLPLVVPTPGNLSVRRALARLDGGVDRLLEAAAGREGLRFRKVIERLDPGDRRAVAKTLLAAGHETTARGLTWSVYLLGCHPDAQARARDEVVHVLDGAKPGVHLLPRLCGLTRVIHESMRLHPPVWMVERRALGPDIIGGYVIPRNTSVALCQYLAHRHPAFWDEPDAFRPDRFAGPADRASRPEFAYFPFGGGTRACIGWRLGMLELHLVLALILRRFEIQSVSGPPPRLSAGVTLGAEPPLRVSLRPCRGADREH